MRKNLVILFAILINSPFMFGQGIQFQNLTWSQLLAKAKTEKKIIFVDAYTTWCGPCKQMASKIFPLATVGSFYNGNFINAKIDMEKGEGLTLAKQYNVTAYPTYLFINGDGKLVHKAIGYYESAAFITIGKDALDPNTQLYTLKEKFNKGTIKPEELYNLAIKAAEVSDKDASKILDAYFKSQADWYSSKNIELMLMMINQENSPETPYYNFLVKNEAKAGQVFGEKRLHDELDNIALRYCMGFVNDKEDLGIAVPKLEKEIMKYRPASAKRLSLIYGIYISGETGGWHHYEKFALQYAEAYSQKLNELELNELAWNFFLHVENKTSLKKALGWALQSVAKEDAYYNNDTVANLYLRLGDKKNAKTYAEKAVRLGKAAGEDVSETEKLLRSL